MSVRAGDRAAMAAPGLGPDRIHHQLAREGVMPVPGRSSVYRALVRNGLIDPAKRKRKRSDFRRWERGRAMELWQMDVMGGVHLSDGCEVKVVTGIDDHSRFVVCARVVRRATAGPVCDALAAALRRHGVPEQILTDIQRQGLHRPVRARSGAGALRPDLHRERDPASADRAVLADHDREGGAAAQDDAGGVLPPARAAARHSRRAAGRPRRLGRPLQH
jgi:transposase InsO family protein